MAALGFGARRASRRRLLAVVPPSPPVAPGYLAGIATAPYAVFGAQKLVADHTGPLFRLRRASDGAELDVGPQAGGSLPDHAALATWAGGAALTVTTLYDQSGNGRHLTQPTVANQPAFDLAQPTNGVVPVLFDGFGRQTNAGLGPNTLKDMYVNGVALDLTTHSIFIAQDPQGSQLPSAAYQLSSSYKGAVQLGVSLANGRHGSIAGPGPRTQLGVFGVTKSTSTVRWFGKETNASQSVGSASAPSATFTLGSSVFTNAGTGAFKLFGCALYNAALSTADGTTIYNSLSTAFAIPTVFDFRLIFGDDSIAEGTGSTLLRNQPHLLAASLTKSYEVFNLAIHGQTLATVYMNRVSRYGAAFVAGKPNVVFVEGGINDISSGTTGANLYANTAGPLVTYLKGLGFKVVHCTLLPRDLTAGQEGERVAYNDLVRANATSADWVLDQASHPVMGPVAAITDTTLYADQVHPRTLGYRWLAGAPSGTYAGVHTYYHALREVLRTATGDAGYVP